MGDEAAEAALRQQLAAMPGAFSPASIMARNDSTPVTLTPASMVTRGDRFTPRSATGPLLSIGSALAVTRNLKHASSRTPRRSFSTAKLPLASRDAFNSRRSSLSRPAAMPDQPAAAEIVEIQRGAFIRSMADTASPAKPHERNSPEQPSQIFIHDQDLALVGHIGATGPEEVALPDDATTCMDSDRFYSDRGTMMQDVRAPSLATSTTTACEVLVNDVVQVDDPEAEQAAAAPKTGIAARLARAWVPCAGHVTADGGGTRK